MEMKDGKSTGEAAEPKAKTRRWLIYILAAVFLFAMTMFMIGQSRRLKGEWALDDTSTYWFDGVDSGELRLPLGKYPFSYTDEDGVLTIDFINPEATDMVYEYEIRGKTLRLYTEDTVYELAKRK